MRLFVAVWPAPDVVATLRGFERPTQEGVRWTREHQWHVTLRFLGSVEEEAAGDLVAALDKVACQPASAVMGPVTACFGRNVLHVPVEGLEPVAAAVVEVTAAFGEPPDPRPFRGHLTLARSGNRRSRGVDLRSFAGLACAGEWTADEITLVQSRPHREGVRYEVLHRHNLRH